MNKKNATEKNSNVSTLLSTIFIVLLVVADQFTKYLSRKVLVQERDISILPGFFRLTYVENRGAAFGIFQNATFFFAITSGIIIVALLYYLFFKVLPPVIKVSVVLILSGAVGNLIDRLYFGFVTDMLDFHGIWKFVFNIADVYVVIGTIALISALLFEEKNKKM